MFPAGDVVLSVAGFVPDASAASDYTGRHIYHRSLREKASPCSGSFYSRAEFRAARDKPAYDLLKSRHDPGGRLGELYEKCVRIH